MSDNWDWRYIQPSEGIWLSPERLVCNWLQLRNQSRINYELAVDCRMYGEVKHFAAFRAWTVSLKGILSALSQCIVGFTDDKIYKTQTTAFTDTCPVYKHLQVARKCKDNALRLNHFNRCCHIFKKFINWHLVELVFVSRIKWNDRMLAGYKTRGWNKLKYAYIIQPLRNVLNATSFLTGCIGRHGKLKNTSPFYIISCHGTCPTANSIPCEIWRYLMWRHTWQGKGILWTSR